jgi:Carboxypeptidase regulatory-like domain
MRAFTSFLIILLSPAMVLGQPPRPEASIRITVVDPSGAVIVGAQVTVRPAGAEAMPISVGTNGRGEALVAPLDPGRYAVHVEAPGFEPYDIRDVRVRAGETRREAKLRLAKLTETVDVGRDPRERASDPRGDAFATILNQAQIEELPDDPDEMEQVLRDMAGPGATLRVNGFRGGRLPPKSQIQQIRFRRNLFAASSHEPGFMSVDIITKPGLDGWRGSTNAGFRDAALNARNTFAPVKGDERHERFGFGLSGPLWKQHTSLSLSVDGIDAFDTKTIVAATPSGYFADSIRKPNDTLNVNARLEHLLTKSQMLRAEVQRNHSFSDNLGVGDFDLPDRAYSQARTENVLRASLTGGLRKALFNELRLQWRGDDTRFDPSSTAPAVMVLNAFNRGGAQLSGGRRVNEIQLADDLDIAVGRHAIRTGMQLDAGRYHTDILRNGDGTFTFSSLAAFSAGAPTTFTRNAGNPDVTVSQGELGAYVEDDVRVRQNVTISGGIRQEIQSHISGLHLGPRGGVTWSPFKSGKTTVRAGAGRFFDWFDAQNYEQAVQLDGTHQQIQTIVQPGYPDAALGGHAFVLPSGRVQIAPRLEQPELREAMAGVEQTLPGDVRVQAMYIHWSGVNLLRGVNVNAPFANGTRPDPWSGPITQIESSASSRTDALSLNLNYMRPARRLFIAANYTRSRSVNDADGPFSLPADNFNLAAERGPALNVPRHRFMSLINAPLAKRFRLGTSLRMQSALPYNITTGRDDNGDTVSNDRPAGVARNTGRGRSQIDLGARLSWSVAFGTRPANAVQTPQIRIVRGDGGDPLGAMGLDATNKRYGLEFFAQAYNLLNHLNATNFSGVLTSPFFGQATAAAPPRRVEIGMRVTF